MKILDMGINIKRCFYIKYGGVLWVVTVGERAPQRVVIHALQNIRVFGLAFCCFFFSFIWTFAVACFHCWKMALLFHMVNKKFGSYSSQCKYYIVWISQYDHCALPLFLSRFLARPESSLFLQTIIIFYISWLNDHKKICFVRTCCYHMNRKYNVTHSYKLTESTNLVERWWFV